MDIDDLRRAFVGNAAFADRIRAFRHERIDAILDPTHPKNLTLIEDGPVFVVHLLPVGMVENPYRFSFTSLAFAETALRDTPHGQYFTSQGTHNLDGVMMPISRGQAPAMQYIQMFRNGAVEYVETTSGYFDQPEQHLSFHALESRVLHGLVLAIRLQRSLDLREPCFVGVSIARADGTHWRGDHRDVFSITAPPMRHKQLQLPEQYVEAWAEPVEAILKPTFDIWANALGWAKSPSYDKTGSWTNPKSLNLPSIDLS